MFRSLIRALCAALMLTGALPAAAETTRAEFVVRYGPIPAGRVVFTGRVEPGGYGVAGELRSTGLLRAVSNLRYTAEAQGGIRGTAFVPVRYSEKARVGDRSSGITMQFVNGTPQVSRDATDDEIKPHHVDPATQNDVLDPASAVFFLLRDLPQDQACRGGVNMFDGKRRTWLSLHNPRISNGALVCDGEYRRVAGFPSWEMEERTSFPFTARYRQGSNGLMQVSEVRIQTVYGAVRLERQ